MYRAIFESTNLSSKIVFYPEDIIHKKIEFPAAFLKRCDYSTNWTDIIVEGVRVNIIAGTAQLHFPMELEELAKSLIKDLKDDTYIWGGRRLNGKFVCSVFIAESKSLTALKKYAIESLEKFFLEAIRDLSICNLKWDYEKYSYVIREYDVVDDIVKHSDTPPMESKSIMDIVQEYYKL